MEENVYILDRVETLAKLFLTRRPDVVYKPVHDGYVGFLAGIMTESPGIGLPRSYCPFFGFAFGTSDELPTIAEANRHSDNYWWRGDDRRFCSPVISLLFSMVDDRGYFGWYAEPTFEAEQPILVHHAKVAHSEIKKNSLNFIVDSIMAWYEALSLNLVRESDSAKAKGERRLAHANPRK